MSEGGHIQKFYKSLCAILPVFFISVAFVAGQELNADEWIPAAGTRPKTFEDYLVQTAWANFPKRSILETEGQIARQKIKLTRLDWAKSLQFSASMTPRDSSILLLLPEDRLQPGTVFPPVFNLGIGVNIGDIITQKNKLKIAEQEAKITDLEMLEYKLAFRKEVLRRYELYERSVEVLISRQQAEDDALTNFNLISELFKKNRATFEEYNQASMTYYETREKRVTAESDINLQKYELEEIVGVKWETMENAKIRFGIK